MAAPVHIALTFTDSHWARAYAVMRSVSVTSRAPQSVQFHLCHESLSVAHNAALDDIAAEFGAVVHHYDVSANQELETLAATLRTTRRYPRIVYARLLLDRLLPKEVGRVLYLDSDVMVLEDLSGLFATDLGGNKIGAVLDTNHLHQRLGRDLRARRDRAPNGTQYFNSGVLLIDLAALAGADILAFARNLAGRVDPSELFFDQDVLNMAFAGAWKPLDWRYNLTAPTRAHISLNPAIVHFTMKPSPWNLSSARVPYARLYRHVMTNRVFYQQVRERWQTRWYLRPLTFVLPRS